MIEHVSGEDLWTLRRVVRAVRYRGRRATRAILAACARLTALVEVPVFLARSRRELLANETVMVFWLWSFGHTITSLDLAARLHHPNRISLVFLPHPRSNDYVPACLEHSFDVFTYRSRIFPGVPEADPFRYRLLRLALAAWSAGAGRFSLIDGAGLYRTLSIAETPILIGDEAAGVLRRSYDITGYVRLLRDGVGVAPRLPKRLREEVRAAIERRFPDFFTGPFVALYLRGGMHNQSFDSAIRSAGPHENYLAAVAYLTARGYHVAGGAEIDHGLFADLDGYFALDELELPADLVDVFRLTECALFIGQLSGPSTLPAACGIPSLVVDGLAHHRGSLRQGDLVLFKHLELASGRRLSLVDVYTELSDLGFGFRYREHGVRIHPNASAEILAAVQEAIELVEGTLTLSAEDEALCAAFAGIIPRSMLLAYEGNRPPLFALRAIRDELLTAGRAPVGAGRE